MHTDPRGRRGSKIQELGQILEAARAHREAEPATLALAIDAYRY